MSVDNIQILMHFIYSILQGLIQGLTEFLPISSSGHLVLFQQFFKIEENFLLFDVLLHFATLLAALIFFRKDISDILLSAKKSLLNFNDRNVKIFWFIIITLMPTILFGLGIKRYLIYSFSSVNFVFVGLTITGILLIISDFIKKRGREIFELSVFEILLIGIAQGVAVLPGISRSGFTIMMAIFIGTKRESAARFSFLIMLPSVFLATVFEIITNPLSQFGGGNIPDLFLAVLVAFGAGFLGIRTAINLTKRAKLKYFGIYLILLVFFCYFIRQS